MTDRMRTLSLEELLDWILIELRSQGTIFGIPRNLFVVPRRGAPYASRLFGQFLATPIGPAAGPHTQLAQNLVTAWLCGGRFIELKTVQVMDDLEIPRPCIDMEDEGYNVEWSQELRLDESLDEYVKAWILVHILRRLFRVEEVAFGTIFNMSVGYDLQGILSRPMQRFMDHLEDASEEIAAIRDTLRTRHPQFADIEIPSRIVDSVTLSTMHGCPPDEVEKIARYLLERRGLHTTVKLNPTLLGKEAVMRILHTALGYRSIDIPDRVFADDLKYGRALELIRSLQRAASERGVTFGVKLSNTLAMGNHRGVLPGEEMYMSGRALYPITINLFHRLTEDLDGELNVSYSAGADALNVTDILAAGARPVTVASDLLKPGGYGRLTQYLANLEAEMAARGATDLDELAFERRSTLADLARAALDDPRYKKSYHPHGLPKLAGSKLDLFDCIAAPCIAQCAVCQDVPEYAHWLAREDDSRALTVIARRNPLPGVTGHVCTRLCETRCTRNLYDEPVSIRQLKRAAVERGAVPIVQAPPADRRRVAVIGGGPSGLAAAYFLAANGIGVTVFEAKDRAGGMLAIAPPFRLPEATVRGDIVRIEAAGVTIECDSVVYKSPVELLATGYAAVYVACGFSEDSALSIDGIGADGVCGALRFLDDVAHDRLPELGSRVVVVGGGNTAMDAARTAQRLTGRPATVVYRRTRAEMPAEIDEVDDLLAEGNELVELATPVCVEVEEGRVVGIRCVRNDLGDPEADGRRRPVPIAGSEFTLPASAIILATGQRSGARFLEGSSISVDPSGRIRIDESTGQTELEGVYAGGDIARGPAIIIQACADGRRAAEAICARLGVAFRSPPLPDRTAVQPDVAALKAARTRKSQRAKPERLAIEKRGRFDLVERTLDEVSTREEAGRCLQCHVLCDRCVEVCPNRANVAIHVPTVDVCLPLLRFQNGTLETVGEEVMTIVQERQIVHIDDLCNECGNCATFCLHDGKPYQDKPRLFLRRDDYEAERDNAFNLIPGGLARRDEGREARLTTGLSGYIYDGVGVRVRLRSDFSVRRVEPTASFAGTRSLRPALEMAALFVGLSKTGSYLSVVSGAVRSSA